MKNKGRGGRVKVFPPFTHTVHFNSNSNVAIRMNGRELITLARPNETPKHPHLTGQNCAKFPFLHKGSKFLANGFEKYPSFLRTEKR